MTAPAVKVRCGCWASEWAHRGYVVCGEIVYCHDLRDARRFIRLALGDDAVMVRCEDGIYCYANQEDADADDTGACADAVIDTDPHP